MKTISKRIVLSCFSFFAMTALCLLVLPGCDDFYKRTITITSPADVSSFDSGDSIPFSMSLTVSTLSGNVCIDNGTIIQWTSNRDGDFWQEEIEQKVCGKNAVTYDQEFSTSALSEGDHTITCKANATDASGATYNLATAQVRIYIRESQASSTTTTTPDGGGGDGRYDLTACTALNDLEVRAGVPEYWNNKTTCYASIILKNNGTRPIWALYYAENTISPEETGWRTLYLDPGQEWNSETIPFWAYQPQTDGVRTIKTTKATAVYYYPDDDDADNDEGCQWIFDDLYSDNVLDVPISTRDVSGLDPCN